MPPALLSRQEVVERLMLVIRRSGYDGASLAALSKATGLGKSSLYHYFPDGKDDMVRAVLEHLESLLQDVLFAPLRSPGPVSDRLDQMIATLDEFYRGGREACVLGNLVLGTSRTRFHRQLAAIFEMWIDALASALVDGGLPPTVARARAEDAVIRIEGALILAGAMNDPEFFGRALRHLATDLRAPVGARS
jgi:TetR/AcrR family transcriptional regulator, lmrAB and yxaGH operons repressor